MNDKWLQNREEQKPGKWLSPGFPWYNLLWLSLLFMILIWLGRRAMSTSEVTLIDYSTFRQQLEQDNVTRVTIVGDQIEGVLKEAIEIETAVSDTPTPYTNFITYLPPFDDETLLPLLAEHNVAIEVKPDSALPIWTIILNFLPILLFFLLLYSLYNRMRPTGEGVFSLGQSHAKLYEQHEERTTFDDVAGLEGVKIELKEVIEYLKAPERVFRLGGTVPKGVLLVGPPGTGKTLLARAVAGEAGVPFFSITGSDFMEMFVGVGASRVRGLFNDARKSAPAIIFIDELDSIGRLRGAVFGGGHEEREQTLNQLLAELDGFEPSENVIVMAATNRPDILDPALLRPGRFDRRITVDLPTMAARQQILEIHARNKPLAEDVKLDQLARGTPGFSGADLENLLNEAALLAARRRRDAIKWVDIEEARDKILMGLVREGLAPTDEECRLIAYHEAGHAMLAALLPHADPIHKVTIVPRGRAMGVTQQLPEREKLIYTREYMLDHLAVMMGGRAAEELIFGTATSGAENDLKQATQLASHMVLDWGMSQQLGHVALGSRQPPPILLGEEITQSRAYSEATACQVDEEIKAILDTAYEQAMDTLRQYHLQLDAVAQALLTKEEISGEEVKELLMTKITS
jgi:cell division protease FtsH